MGLGFITPPLGIKKVICLTTRRLTGAGAPHHAQYWGLVDIKHIHIRCRKKSPNHQGIDFGKIKQGFDSNDCQDIRDKLDQAGQY